ncbi:SNARE-associated protein Snapin isoform X1 [Zalophus californianus]|uniref:Biogenesis of lysosome-related organelles complex 1 subunit 7 n=1 Tax=Zalophus californianus TaxID=9704 RepID=A0A6J2EIW7_ZALCA|nr:SNARE-associated protein Snapin isoform X1 [Zalophus californianus]
MGGLSATGETSISFSPPQNTKDSRPQNCSSQPPGGLETPPNTASPGPPRNCCSARPAPDRGDSVSQKSPGWVQPAAPGRPLVVHFRATPVPGGPRGTFPAEGLLMMAAAGSAAVSGAGTPVAGPAGRDLFAEGLLEFLRPAVQQLDSHVHAVRESQVELREQIDNLATGTAEAAKPQRGQGNSPQEGNAGFRSLPAWFPKQVTGQKMGPMHCLRVAQVLFRSCLVSSRTPPCRPWDIKKAALLFLLEALKSYLFIWGPKETCIQQD